jgi:transcriptional regulator with XRE-family HTH domain
MGTIDDHGRTMIRLDRLGARLAEGRRASSLSQREVARRVGVSASLISQIETGKVQPSVATLMAVVNELDLSIDEMLRVAEYPFPQLGPLERAPVESPDAAAMTPAAPTRNPADTARRRALVQAAGDRARIELDTGVTWERLTAESDPDVDFILVTYPPGASSSVGDQLLTHAGKEYWFVISGELRVQVVFDEYVAGPNDSFSFECTLPHQFRNDGEVPVTAVVTIVRSAGGTSPRPH